MKSPKFFARNRDFNGPLATLRRTLAQSAGAIMWSVRMIGVAIAFLAPWVIAIVAVTYPVGNGDGPPAPASSSEKPIHLSA